MDYEFAPMEGITDWRYRRAHSRAFSGVDRYYMPFLSPSQGHAFTRREKEEIDPAHNAGVRVVPQLLTRRAEDFLWAAGELAALGYREVNLNLGCPSGTVTAKGKGAGFLARPEELEAFLDAIFSAGLPIAISVKTRLGMRSEEEFPALLALYNRYPIARLIIHPRVREDYYRRPVRPGAFVRALGESRNPVGYNGDLVTAEDCRRAERTWPDLASLMAGRALVGDPALFRKARGGPPASKEELERFHGELYETYAAAFGSRRNAMLRMKELWFYHIHLFRDGEKYGKHLKKARDPAEFEAWSAAAYRDLELLEDLPRVQ